MKKKEIKSKPERVFWAIIGIISLIVILNPGAGIIDLIPDNLPLIGNLDEATAGALLVKSVKEIF